MSSRGDPSDPVESLDAERALEALAERYDRVRPSRWAPVPEALDQAIAADVALGEAARRARRHLPEEVESRLCPFLPAASVRPYEGALLTVPRERFVLPEDLALSAIDTPLSLDQKGNATISAPHAYLLTFALLDLREGDHLLELGTGTGYGAALALSFLGPRGHVTSIEIDPVLAERARRILASPDLGGGDRLTLVEGDALAFADRLPARKDRRGPEGHHEAENEVAVQNRLRAQQLNPTKVKKKGFDLKPQPDLRLGRRAQGPGQVHPPVRDDDRRRPAPRAVPRDPLQPGAEPRLPGRAPATSRAPSSRARHLQRRAPPHPKIFDELFVNLVQAGEVGGILDTILNRLAVYIEKRVKLVRQVKRRDDLPHRRHLHRDRSSWS
jgi:SAM-dependent methyltransferase